jgi:hypothetical protein
MSFKFNKSTASSSKSKEVIENKKEVINNNEEELKETEESISKPTKFGKVSLDTNNNNKKGKKEKIVPESVLSAIGVIQKYLEETDSGFTKDGIKAKLLKTQIYRNPKDPSIRILVRQKGFILEMNLIEKEKRVFRINEEGELELFQGENDVTEEEVENIIKSYSSPSEDEEANS